MNTRLIAELRAALESVCGGASFGPSHSDMVTAHANAVDEIARVRYVARHALDNTEAAEQPEDALIFQRREPGPIVPGVIASHKTRPPLIIDDPGVTFRSRQAIERYEAMARVCKALLAQGHPCPSPELRDAIAALESLK